MNKQNNWGGKRDGAGRKPGSLNEEYSPSKVVRLPIETARFQREVGIAKVLGIIKHWEAMERQASRTSPRWVKLRKMLNELRELENWDKF